MIDAQKPTGNIYDLGYQPYEGERLGRQYALVALFNYSLRAVFGLGRSGWNKVMPIGLAGIAMIPAFLQISIAALVPGGGQVVTSEGYFAFVWVVFPIFAAVAAPEIMGRDQRNRTLPLYFSRALSRFDYISAKVAALFTGMFAIMVVPQILLFIGIALAADDILDYIWHNLDLFPPILASSVLAALELAAISLAIGSQTSRRGLASGTIFVFFIMLTIIGGQLLVETVDGDFGRYCILSSPLDVINGMTYWLFGADVPPDSAIGRVDLPGPVYLAAVLTYTAAGLTWVYRRFMRMAL